ncbi:MAG: hypothetical protein ACOC2U_02925, partial [bacterium]
MVRIEFPMLNSKVVQNFLRQKYFKAKTKAKKPIKPSLIVDSQSFNIRIFEDNSVSWFWLRLFRRNFPLLGKYLVDKIEDPTKIKQIEIYEKGNKLYCKLIYVVEIIEKPLSKEGTALDLNVKKLVLDTNDFLDVSRLMHRKLEHKKNKMKSRNLNNFTRDFVHKTTTTMANLLKE